MESNEKIQEKNKILKIWIMEEEMKTNGFWERDREKPIEKSEKQDWTTMKQVWEKMMRGEDSSFVVRERLEA